MYFWFEKFILHLQKMLPSPVIPNLIWDPVNLIIIIPLGDIIQIDTLVRCVEMYTQKKG